MKGKLIVCDGSNGAGKSTALQAIQDHLKSKSINYIATREPGGTDIGEAIRALLLDKSNTAMCSDAELMLFAASRAQHLQEKIYPALAQGTHVISDRFESATVSFQQYGRGLSAAKVEQLNNLVLGEFRPHLTIVLDLDPQIGLQRVMSRGQGLDRMENVDIAFLERARQGYLAQAAQFPERFCVIDASAPLEQVITNVLDAVDKEISSL